MSALGRFTVFQFLLDYISAIITYFSRKQVQSVHICTQNKRKIGEIWLLVSQKIGKNIKICLAKTKQILTWDHCFVIFTFIYNKTTTRVVLCCFRIISCSINQKLLSFKKKSFAINVHTRKLSILDMIILRTFYSFLEQLFSSFHLILFIYLFFSTPTIFFMLNKICIYIKKMTCY